jgi:Caenorhabditis protein of unknown function, DUF268
VPNERVIEVPWALSQLPQSGAILDVGSCDASYLTSVMSGDRVLHCMDTRDCSATLPSGAIFHHESIIGNSLPSAYFDAILMLSTIEHVGLPCYGQRPFPMGDRLALAAVRPLLKPSGRLLMTVPVGRGTTATWYREYSVPHLRSLLQGWESHIEYWGFDGAGYAPIPEAEVGSHEYRDRSDEQSGAGAVAGIVARLLNSSQSLRHSTLRRSRDEKEGPGQFAGEPAQ